MCDCRNHVVGVLLLQIGPPEVASDAANSCSQLQVGAQRRTACCTARVHALPLYVPVS